MHIKHLNGYMQVLSPYFHNMIYSPTTYSFFLKSNWHFDSIAFTKNLGFLWSALVVKSLNNKFSAHSLFFLLRLSDCYYALLKKNT